MDSLICITRTLENIAFSVLRYVMVALHYSMLHPFETFLPLEQSRTALLGCRLAALRLREAAPWQLSLEFKAY